MLARGPVRDEERAEGRPRGDGGDEKGGGVLPAPRDRRAATLGAATGAPLHVPHADAPVVDEERQAEDGRRTPNGHIRAKAKPTANGRMEASTTAARSPRTRSITPGTTARARLRSTGATFTLADTMSGWEGENVASMPRD